MILIRFHSQNLFCFFLLQGLIKKHEFEQNLKFMNNISFCKFSAAHNKL